MPMFARKRKSRHNRRMAKDYRNIGEVSVAINGIHRILAVYAGIFVVAVAIGCTMLGFMWSELSSVGKAIARIEGKLDGLPKKIAQARAPSRFLTGAEFLELQKNPSALEILSNTARERPESVFLEFSDPSLSGKIEKAIEKKQ